MKIKLMALYCLVTILTGVQAKPMNVVFILADDLGWADTTLYGKTSLYDTPNLERLAKRGMTFSRAYSNSPLCSPTRASILTGQTPARHGSTAPQHHMGLVRLKPTINEKSMPAGNKALQTDSVTRLDTELPTLGKMMKKAGYSTAHFGKWHLGPEPFSPLEHGFDVDLPHYAGPGPKGSFVAPWKYDNFDPNYENEHIEDRMAEEAVAWMNSVKGSKPYFMNYWMFSVHAPFDAKSELIDEYRKKIDPNDAQRSPTYAAMIHSMDDAVGSLLDAVEASGMADETIIIFTSDNGGNMYNGIVETGRDGKEYISSATSNFPLRGGKATMFEGGVRVPTVIVWPGVTKPGSRSDEVIQSADFYPTLLKQLKVRMPKNHVVDGQDITPLLKGGKLNRRGIVTYFPHSPPVPDWLPPSMSFISGDWKLIRLFHQGEGGAHDYLLYNLKNDIGEQNNLAKSNPEMVQTLDRMMENYIRNSGAVVPLPNPKFDPEKYNPSRVGKQPGGLKISSKSKQKSVKTAGGTAGGWTAGGTCAVKAVKKSLQIKSSGKDPFIQANAFSDFIDGPFTVRLRMKSDASGQGAVYYGKPPSPDRMPHFDVNHDGEWHEYAVEIPADTLNGLRIDPARGAGELLIQWIRLEDSKGEVLKEWEF
ncbi:sulfatase [Pontiellaceae bacterium B12227]|nr:sulfatase [Pontiellaceae bacterium B12227]